MQGVEILSTIQIATAWRMDWVAFTVMAVITFLFCLAAGTHNMIEWQDLIPYGIAGIFIGMFIGYLFGHNISGIPAEYETHYKVVISDEVSMTEFYEHYEVIDQDGKIFTVREKTDEE